MKHLVLICGLIIFFASAATATYACSCGKITGTIAINNDAPKPGAEEVKRWRLEQNQVAFFVGQVIKIEKVKIKNSENSNERSPMKEVTVRVNKYWLGVKSPEMIIYTGVGGGDCGVPYVKGQEYFFWASRAHVSGLLETGICSRFSQRTSTYGSGAINLVSVDRPESAAVRAQHLSGASERFHQVDPTRLLFGIATVAHRAARCAIDEQTSCLYKTTAGRYSVSE